MTPAQAELLHNYRRLIADMQRDMEAFQAADMVLRRNGKDVTAEHMAMMAERIASLEKLVERHDPEGWTTLK